MSTGNTAVWVLLLAILAATLPVRATGGELQLLNGIELQDIILRWQSTQIQARKHENKVHGVRIPKGKKKPAQLINANEILGCSVYSISIIVLYRL
jgi:hypothetical protein